MEWIGYLAAVIAAIWVHRDAKARGSKHPWLWAFGVLMILVVFLPLYLIFRPKKKTAGEPDAVCTGCGKPIEGNYPFCPACGQIRKKSNE